MFPGFISSLYWQITVLSKIQVPRTFASISGISLRAYFLQQVTGLTAFLTAVGIHIVSDPWSNDVIGKYWLKIGFHHIHEIIRMWLKRGQDYGSTFKGLDELILFLTVGEGAIRIPRIWMVNGIFSRNFPADGSYWKYQRRSSIRTQ